ncbi:MAG: hypothetical protein JO010_10690 [Alphaproteobacteria bacterium]|nr:hypothetical protein [Alphaproteobacteria bacterium]
MLLLAACADGSANWTKSGASAEAISRDLAACRTEARDATRRDAQIDTDILATRGNDWQRTGTLALHQDSMTAERRADGQGIVERCMAAKGYLRRSGG